MSTLIVKIFLEDGKWYYRINRGSGWEERSRPFRFYFDAADDAAMKVDNDF